LLLRYLPPRTPEIAAPNVVLYMHGGTFPSALSIAFRFDGRYWRDDLAAAGFHTWALDFHGFGRLSDPFPQFDQPTEKNPPLGRAEDANRQLEEAVRFICNRHGIPHLSIIAHSWGSIAAGRLAARCPDLIKRMVFLGATRRPRKSGPQRLGA
jgi:pimeloyl-ACP methyl ester carboxylesterase